MNDHDRDPFDGPAPVGPLGEAMSRLTDDALDADFTVWTIRSRHENGRSARRQIVGGLAAGVAALGVMVLLFTTIGRNGSTDSATAASGAVSSSAGLLSGSLTASSSASASAAAGSAAGSSSSAATSSSSAAAAPGSSPAGSSGAGSTTQESSDASGRAPDAGAAPPAAGGEGATVPNVPSDGSVTGGSPACRTLPLTAAQDRALAASIPGAVPVEACAADDIDLGVQRYAIAGGTLLVEVRAGGFDPCAAAGSSDCTDVPDHPGVRTRTPSADGQTEVWISGRAGSVVLTAAPDGLLSVAVLAAAAQAVADAS